MFSTADRSGRPRHIHTTFVNQESLHEKWSTFAKHFSRASSLEPFHREILVLRTAYLCRCDYEWGQHVLVASETGLSESHLNAIQEGGAAAVWGVRERVLLQMADELHVDIMVSDETWGQAVQEFRKEQIFDALFTVGFYTMTAMALRTLGVELEPGVEGLPS
jgi:alkylhydroperoxidase family enzyme